MIDVTGHLTDLRANGASASILEHFPQANGRSAIPTKTTGIPGDTKTGSWPGKLRQ